MQKRNRKRIVGRTITGTVLLGCASLVGLGFVPKALPVSVAKVERGALEVAVAEPGKTRIRNKLVISTPVTGQLARINLKVGDIVEQGAVLAEVSAVAPQLLDARARAQANARVAVAQATLARAQAAIQGRERAIAFARNEAERARRLREQSGLSDQALEQAEYELRSAEDELTTNQLSEQVASNELSAAEAALASTRPGSQGANGKVTLVAPTRGQVLRVLQEHAGVVQAGTELVEIGDPRALEVVVDVLTTDAVQIEVGDAASIERWGGVGGLTARVRSKQPSAFSAHSALGVEEQRVPVLLDILAPPEKWRSLGDGYQVEARIFVDKVDDAVTVPASALFRSERGWAVFVVQHGQAKLANIEIGTRTPDSAEVLRGLSAGQSVVLYPSDQIGDGTDLEIRAVRAL